MCFGILDMKAIWHHNESANDFLDRIGVKTTRNEKDAWWAFNGKTVPRPEHVRNMESVLKEEFGIEVTIEDEKGIKNG